MRLVRGNWGEELRAALADDASEVRIVAPFVKAGAVSSLFGDRQPESLRVAVVMPLAFALGLVVLDEPQTGLFAAAGADRDRRRSRGDA